MLSHVCIERRATSPTPSTRRTAMTGAATLSASTWQVPASGGGRCEPARSVQGRPQGHRRRPLQPSVLVGDRFRSRAAAERGRRDHRSKRDSPTDFLGQFGIGILSCFVVADEVTLVTRKSGSSKSFRWIGHSDGTYELSSLEATAPIGTAVYLRPKADSEPLFNADKILDTARHYGELLPIKITFTHAGRRDEFGGEPLPWQDIDLASDAGLSQILGYGESLFGNRMMAAIPIRSTGADANGIAFLLSEPRSVHVPQNHRAYLRRMLVSDSISGLTPDWAYFVRCVVNVNDLRPTAGRESFYEDDKLE